MNFKTGSGKSRATRNVAPVDGAEPQDTQSLLLKISDLEVNLAEALEVAEHNYLVAEQLGAVLDETQARLAEAEALNGKLQSVEPVQVTEQGEVVDKKAKKGKTKTDDEQVSVEVQSE